MRVLTKASVKRSEKIAVSFGRLTYSDLMLRAGKRAAETINNRSKCKDKKIAVLCGNGNNGGDGYVVAAELLRLGAYVTVIAPFGEPLTENALLYRQRLPKDIVITDSFTDSYDIIVEAIFGIGLNRKLPDSLNFMLEDINRSNAVRVAIDIPCGVEADSSRLLGTPFSADYTVTFIAAKPCFLLPPGSDYCGDVFVADIGVVPVSADYLTIEKPYFKTRSRNSHKGSYGTALTLCGSYGMAGAAMLSAKAAMRSGVGITKCVVCDGIYSAFTSFIPEAVCVPIKQSHDGALSADEIDISSLCSGCDAVLFGCGVGIGEDCEKILEMLLTEQTLPTVIDADGINLLSRRIELLRKSKAPLILTPHPGEMARLCGKTVAEIEADRVEISRKFATEYGCVLVLKGANTIVASPNGEIYFNPTGNPGMATAGSGDVLAGITVSLLAQGFDPLVAAKSAVYIHGSAGDRAAAKRSEHAILASDIIEEL